VTHVLRGALLSIVLPAAIFAGAQETASPPPGFVTLSREGETVGPLEKHRVEGKYTVFDIFADWCAPCRLIDARLREITAERKDVAVRKLNVVSFESPLARELGPDFETLPFVVVFSPDGKRTDILGADLAKLDRTLGAE
jgi:thiol-disulfide isomerase/thioredoxin